MLQYYQNLMSQCTSATVIGAYTFGLLAFLFAYQAIILMYGDQAASEFLECLVDIFVVHLIIEIAKNPLKYLLGFAVAEQLAILLLIIHGVSHFKECLEELYGHLFVSLQPQHLLGRHKIYGT